MTLIAKPSWIKTSNLWLPRAQTNPDVPYYTIPGNKILTVNPKIKGLSPQSLVGRGGITHLQRSSAPTNLQLNWFHSVILGNTGKPPSSTPGNALDGFTLNDMRAIVNTLATTTLSADEFQEGVYGTQYYSTQMKYFYQALMEKYDNPSQNPNGYKLRHLGTYGSFASAGQWNYYEYMPGTGGSAMAPNNTNFKQYLQTKSKARELSAYHFDNFRPYKIGTNVKNYIDRPDYNHLYYLKKFQMLTICLAYGRVGGAGGDDDFFVPYVDWPKIEGLGNSLSSGYKHSRRIEDPDGYVVNTIDQHQQVDYDWRVGCCFAIGYVEGSGCVQFNTNEEYGTNPQIKSNTQNWVPDVPGTAFPSSLSPGTVNDYYPDEMFRGDDAAVEAGYYYKEMASTEGSTWKNVPYRFDGSDTWINPPTDEGSDNGPTTAILEHAAAFGGPYDRSSTSRRGRPDVMVRIKGTNAHYWAFDPSIGKNKSEKIYVKLTDSRTGANDDPGKRFMSSLHYTLTMKKLLTLLLLLPVTFIYGQSPPLSIAALKALINSKFTATSTDKVTTAKLKEVNGAIVDALGATNTNLQSVSASFSNSNLSVSGAQSLTNTSSTAPKSIFITDAGKAGLFTLDAADTTTPSNGLTVLVTSSGLRYKRSGQGNRFSSSQVGTTYDRTAFTSLYNLAVAQADKTVIDLEGRTFNLGSTGIVIDQSRMRITNGVLSCPTLTSGTCVTVKGSTIEDGTYKQGTSGGDYLEIVGPGASYTNTVGLSYEASGAGPSQFTNHGIIARGFGTGVKFGANSYAITINGGASYGNTVGVDIVASTNSGEANNLDGFRIFNNHLGIRVSNNTSDTYMKGSSLNYNDRQAEINGGVLEFHGVHHEWANKSDTLYVVKGPGGVIYFVGGTMRSTENTTKPAYLFRVDTPYGAGGGVFGQLSLGSGVETSSLYQADGPGQYKLKLLGTYNTPILAPMTSRSETLLIDGGFEGGGPTDNFLVTGTVARTSSLSATNAVLSYSTSEHRTGSKSLKFDKDSFGGGSTSSFDLYVPIVRGEAASAEAWVKKPGSGSGTVYYTFSYGTLRQGLDGYPVWVPIQDFTSNHIDFSSSATSWTRIGTESHTRPGMGATHLRLSVGADGFSGGAIYFDDAVVNQQ